MKHWLIGALVVCVGSAHGEPRPQSITGACISHRSDKLNSGRDIQVRWATEVLTQHPPFEYEQPSEDGIAAIFPIEMNCFLASRAEINSFTRASLTAAQLERR